MKPKLLLLLLLLLLVQPKRLLWIGLKFRFLKRENNWSPEAKNVSRRSLQIILFWYFCIEIVPSTRMLRSLWSTRYYLRRICTVCSKDQPKCFNFGLHKMALRQFDLKGLGCGTVDRVVIAVTRGPQFKSSHRLFVV